MAPPAAPQNGGAGFEFRFAAPEGWQIRRDGADFVLVSNVHPGIILVWQHTLSSLAELKAEAAQGIVEPTENTRMLPVAPPAAHGAAGVAVEWSGVYEGERAKAYAIGVMSGQPGGGGVVIVAGTSEEKYNDTYPGFARHIAQSLQFSKIEQPDTTTWWRNKLSGRCLSYLSSSYSSGSSVGGYGTYSSFSDRAHIGLLADGRFAARSSSQASGDTGGAFGSLSSRSGWQQGTWSIEQQGAAAKLVLRYQAGGRVEAYTLASSGSRTLLNGRRWFVVGLQECR